jgi:hypothetical protein
VFVVYLADAVTMRHHEHPLLVVNLPDDDHDEDEDPEDPIEFRALPIVLFSLHHQVMSGTQLLEEYMDRLGPDGICREHPGRVEL